MTTDDAAVERLAKLGTPSEVPAMGHFSAHTPSAPNNQADAPLAAYHFAAQVVPINKAAASESPRTFSGTAYSGKKIIHDWWGPLVFDLSTTKAAAPKIPALMLHDRNQRAGFCGLQVIGSSLAIDSGVLLDNEHGRKVAAESDQGFPWQLSVHIVPGRVEGLAAGGSATVNGQTVEGPCQVWRDNVIREVSFTPTGVDSDTTAAACGAGTGPWGGMTAAQEAEVDRLAKIDTPHEERDHHFGLSAEETAVAERLAKL